MSPPEVTFFCQGRGVALGEPSAAEKTQLNVRVLLG
jgi:hypothetical protein